MSRPLLLDLFCGQGGAAKGYHDAGFDVIGVDINPQPRYPFPFRQMDALEALAVVTRGGGLALYEPDGTKQFAWGSDVAVIHASPPCQAHSTITPDPSKHVDLIGPTRDLLLKAGRPWVIENVEGARGSMVEPARVCGSALGLRVRRHRLFESSVPVDGTACAHREQGTPVGVYGALRRRHWARPDGTSRGTKATSVEEAREVMGMPWADWVGCTQAVPPAYTEHIGRQMLAHICSAARREEDGDA